MSHLRMHVDVLVFTDLSCTNLLQTPPGLFVPMYRRYVGDVVLSETMSVSVVWTYGKDA